MRASWRRDLDRVDTADRASNHMCPICENHVWTYAPGKSYVVYNHENYHPACLKEAGIELPTEVRMPSQKLVNELHDIIQRNRAKTGLAPLVQCEKCWRWNEPQVPCLKCKESRLSLEALTLRNREIERRQQLFDQDATCGTCWQPIEKVEDCSNVKLANGQEYLCHNNTACFWKSVNGMIERFADKPRRVS